MSLSKNQLKLITSLQQKKYRNLNKLFVAEGTKVVNEFLNSKLKLHHIFYVNNEGYEKFENSTTISEIELKKISTLKTPNNVLALFGIPEEPKLIDNGLILALDKINDPGNLGTIIRLCDWFGVTQLVCSKDTVDCFNQKVVQSSMGSLTRVSIVYTNLSDYLKATELPTYATAMTGENVYKTELPKNGVLIMGNEANGISEAVFNTVKNTLSIPRFGEIQATESLNVATATAILLSEFKRST